MRKVSDFNNVYNVQDVIILDVILKNCQQKIKETTGFNPGCFTLVSTLSGAIERVKSKMIITLPKDVESVELMESLLSGWYASVHTRLGFDTEIFTPKSSQNISKKEDIVKQLHKLYREKDEKKKEENFDEPINKFMERGG